MNTTRIVIRQENRVRLFPIRKKKRRTGEIRKSDHTGMTRDPGLCGGSVFFKFLYLSASMKPNNYANFIFLYPEGYLEYISLIKSGG